MNTIFNFTHNNLESLIKTTNTSEGMMVLYTVLGALVTLLIFFVVITWFGYIPIKRAVKDRSEMIQKEIDEALESNKLADQYKNLTNYKLESALNEYDKSISKAEIDGTIKKNKIILKAKEDAKKIILDAQEKSVKLKDEMKNEAMDEITDIAVSVASKIIEKEINDEINQKLIDDLLKQID